MTAPARTDENARTISLQADSMQIPVRRLEFEISSPPRYFLAGNATATTFIAVLSAAFPPGERFFIESVRRFRDRVADPELNAAVKGFIGQEAIHGREHDRLNELLVGCGLNTRVPERGVRVGLMLLERCSASQQLACTALMEHFTALLGEVLLEDEDFQALGDAEMLQLFLWHALEELEHKAVTYDLYNLVGNRRWERWLAFPLVTVTLLPPIFVSWSWLMLKEGKLTDRQDMREGLTLLFGRKGLVSRALGKMGLYVRPDFHPNKKDTRSLVASWRERLFGERGTLTAQLRH